MGAGKSAVGRYIARALNLTFVDSDDEIESRTGVDIPFVFEKEGEEGFRKREAVVIDDLSKMDGVVLATGGGGLIFGRSTMSMICTGGAAGRARLGQQARRQGVVTPDPAGSPDPAAESVRRPARNSRLNSGAGSYDANRVRRGRRKPGTTSSPSRASVSPSTRAEPSGR